MSRQYVTYIKEQYNYVKESRNVVFEYCKTVSSEDFINQNTSFGRGGSMRNLLVHIANTYEYWIANLALKKDPKYAEYEDNLTVQDVILLFDTVDLFMEEFIREMDLSDREIVYEIQGNKNSASSLKFFSHVITHEYHHKGQILSLSRHLDYIPVDTDIMR
ncbi:DinB family protein [Flavobacterium sp. MMLR14_040]|uniref:DinB family protein n=1 Tax=Flavobacterium sp. MMLR14_040 TaxID=3093843 RepID=UPI00298FCD16|nr:DinB family protein [Flavobacterium sp. MMLR14_040]MDW8849974.1 DinB family protein [Flavobacterium sp. MMLR14_040]